MREMEREHEENIILKQRIELLNERISLLNEKLEIKDQLIELEKKLGEVYRKAFEAEQQLTDRALKLSKKGPLEQIVEWIIRIFIFVATYFAMK